MQSELGHTLVQWIEALVEIGQNVTILFVIAYDY
jgi:hypothetical protein